MSDSTTNSNAASIGTLFRRVFRLYQRHFVQFWRVMLPIIIISLVIDIVMLYCFYNHFPNTSWFVGTSSGFSVKTESQSTDFWNFTFTYSSCIFLLLWFTVCPLILMAYKHFRGEDTSVQNVWQHTFRRFGTILGASLLILAGIVVVILSLVLIFFIQSYTLDSLVSVIALWITVFAFLFVILYFIVKLSLFNQGIMIENLSSFNTLRRSNELVKDRWGGFFGRYLLLLWGTGVITGLIFAETFILLSLVVPDYVPIRDLVLSENFLFILIGIDLKVQFNNVNFSFGNVDTALSGIPPYWSIGVILIIKIFISALITPIWAILTTHLYMEQTGDEFNT